VSEATAPTTATEKWSFDCGAPNSLPDAFAADQLSLGGEQRG